MGCQSGKSHEKNDITMKTSRVSSVGRMIDFGLFKDGSIVDGVFKFSFFKIACQLTKPSLNSKFYAGEMTSF